MATYSDVVQDSYLRPVPGASVYVFNRDGSEAAVSPNPVVTGVFGQFDFSAPDAVYDLEFRFGGVTLRQDSVVVGNPPEYIGLPGPAANARASLALFKAAPTTDLTSTYDRALWTWETANAPYVADDVNVVKANSTALSVGAWVRQTSGSITFRRPGSSAITRPVEDKLSETLSIADHGALAGDTGNQGPAIQKAIDTAFAMGGGSVMIPRGRFRVTTSITMRTNVELYGQGASSALHFVSTTSAGLLKAIGTQSVPLSKIKLRDLALEGDAVFTAGVPSVQNGSAVDFQFANDCLFADLTISGFSSNGIAVANGSRNLAISNQVDRCEQAISFYANAIDVEGNKAIGNYVTHNGHFNGIHFEGGAGDGLGEGNLYNSIIQGNTVIDCYGHGYNIERSPNSIVSGNTAVRCGVGNIGTNEGFFFFGSGLCAITGNVAVSCLGRSFLIGAGCNECSLTGNTSFGCGLPPLISDSNGVQVTTNVAVGFNSFNEGDVLLSAMNTSIRNRTYGFQFKNAASADPKTLDWYEEAAFTPVAFGTTTAGTGTYTAQVGRFTRRGNRVEFQLTLGWSAHTGTGTLRIAGLPYTSHPGLKSAVSAAVNGLALPTGSILQAVVPQNDTRLEFYSYVPTAGDQTALPMDSAVPEMIVTGSYEVAP